MPNSSSDWLKALVGPGLITGASEDEPSGIGTYSQVRAQIGRVTGQGLAANIR